MSSATGQRFQEETLYIMHMLYRHLKIYVEIFANACLEYGLIYFKSGILSDYTTNNWTKIFKAQIVKYWRVCACAIEY